MLKVNLNVSRSQQLLTFLVSILQQRLILNTTFSMDPLDGVLSFTHLHQFKQRQNQRFWCNHQPSHPLMDSYLQLLLDPLIFLGFGDPFLFATEV